jgi:hypothetical protein
VYKSTQNSLQESLLNEIKIKKELEEKHTQAMAEIQKNLRGSDDKVQTLTSKLKAAEAEAPAIDKIIFRKFHLSAFKYALQTFQAEIYPKFFME